MDINHESLARTTKELMFDEPFYGLLLVSLNKVFDESVKTACVSVSGISFSLKIAPTFWHSLSPIQKKGLLKHELMHLAFFHLTDYDHLVNRLIANYAMDIEINQYIDSSWLPENGLGLHSFPELKLKPKQGTKYYYDKLLELHDDVKQKLTSAAENGDTSIELPDGTNITLTNHDWGDVESLDEGTQRVIREQLKGILISTAETVQKNKGSVPGEFAEILNALLEEPESKFDWKGYIRRFSGKSVKIYTKKSRRKLSKRYEGNPGLKIKQKKHILVAIDTSGSVSKSELTEFLSEIYHLQKTGSEVTIIHCDTAISHVDKYVHGKEYVIHGRGGTSFQPVIDYYNEHIKNISCLIYFTDGEAPAPINARGNILWVLSSKSKDNQELPGAVIKLDV